MTATREWLRQRPPAAIMVAAIGLMVVPVTASLLLRDFSTDWIVPAWLLTMAPAVPAAYARGWRGAVAALVAALFVLGVGQAAAAMLDLEILDRSSLVTVVATFGAFAVGIGWLAERSARERMFASRAVLGVSLIIDGDGRIRYVSPGVREILGYDPRELVGMGVHLLVHADDLHRVGTNADSKLSDQARPLGDLRFRRKDGRWRVLETMGRRDGGDGPDVEIVIDARDASERIREEEQLRLRFRMQAVGRLAAGTAHDFNNVLTGLQGHVNLLLDQIATDDPRRTEIEGVKKAADRAASLTRQLLAFSRQQVLRPEVVDLNVIIVAMEDLMRGLLGDGVTLEIHPGPNASWVKVDPLQIEHAILSLAANARDAMPAGGDLTVTTEEVEIDEAFAKTFPYHVATGPYTMLTIRDTGVGMDEETRARIFEPFFTTKENGRGLGLSAAYGTIKQSGGYIWVDSKEEKGSTFRIYLPRVDASGDADDEAGRDEADSRRTGTATVLVVEDDAMVRSIVRRVLLQRGYSILEAYHGRDALWMAEGYPHPIDLLLTDIVMPEMSGRDLVHHLSASRPEMRVLFMSGYTDDAVLSPDVFPESTAFIQKPFTPDALARKVQEVLSGTRDHE